VSCLDCPCKMIVEVEPVRSGHGSTLSVTLGRVYRVSRKPEAVKGPSGESVKVNGNALARHNAHGRVEAAR
jgi:hypothetical protein